MKPYAKVLAASLLVAATGVLTSVGAAKADQWQALRDDTRIHSGLTAIAVGRRVHFECPDISARMLRALTFAEGLVAHAQSLGYSRAEVDAFIDSDVEQDRYTDVARRYFAQNGRDFDNQADICALGRDEIAAGSTIGRLLR